MEHRGTEAQRQIREEINQVCYAIVGAAIEVHRTLGPGFLESVYDEALVVELRLRGLSVERQVRIPIEYKGVHVAEHVIDLIVDGDIVVELKAIEELHSVHSAQVHSYLKAGAFDVGLLINFNVDVLKDGVKRIIRKGAELSP